MTSYARTSTSYPSSPDVSIWHDRTSGRPINLIRLGGGSLQPSIEPWLSGTLTRIDVALTRVAVTYGSFRLSRTNATAIALDILLPAMHPPKREMSAYGRCMMIQAAESLFCFWAPIGWTSRSRLMPSSSERILILETLRQPLIRGLLRLFKERAISGKYFNDVHIK